jgi:DNA-binding response OmpR family regulator
LKAGKTVVAGGRVSSLSVATTRVLVIDDEPPIRMLCRVNLEAEGMEVLEAVDGPSGIEVARSELPDAILLDVMMPGIDGWQVAELLLEDEATRDVPIIFLTARADLQDRVRGLEIGGVDYVTKPFNPAELEAVVRRAVERSGSGALRAEGIAELRALFDG